VSSLNESRLGPFSLEEKLGGKKSSVYRAIHLEQRKQVVLKVFTVPFGVTEHSGSEFLDEMNLLRQLSHPNIVRCFGGKIEENVGYTVWELIDGESLAELVTRKGRFPWDQALEYAEAIAAGLMAAQQLDLTHQELNPKKILIARDGRLKIADFRRDRINNPWCFAARKKSRTRWSYQAPEQHRGQTHVTPKADLYALGGVLFHMLTGRPPFVSDSVEEIRAQHLESPAPRASSVALDCPVWLDALVAQLLEKDPNRRPHSAEAAGLMLAEAKRKVQARSSVTQHALGGFSALKMPADKQEARRLFGGRRARDEANAETTPVWERPWALALALIVLLAILGAGLSFAFKPPTEDQLIRSAERLMASENPVNWREAEDSYLQPLLKRFPSSDYVPKAKEHLDTIAMHQAEQHAKTLQRLGRTPSHEGERLYSEALRYEQFGDRLTALDKYQGIVSLLKPEGEDRPFVLLAKRRIAAITEDKSSSADAREKFVREKLSEAELLHEEGKHLQARKIWYGLESLYGNNAELAPLIDQARERLKEVKEPAP
jgi:eukaryotic-like serine/threonine-protein kinase